MNTNWDQGSVSAPGTPYVSVVIPLKNCAQYVAEALESVCAQDYRDLEVLVIDDGSTDGSQSIVEGFGDERVRLLSNEGQGISDGFNTGLRHAAGMYLMRCDADDWFTPGRISRQVAWMEAHPEVGVCCGLQEICWEDGEVVLEAGVDRTAARSVSATIRAGRSVPRTVCAIYRTAALREVGGCRPYFRTCEDDDLLMRLAERFDIWEVPDLVYRTRLRPSSITRTTSVAELRWFVAKCREFQRQRLEAGQDDLDRGRPPEVPERFESSRAKPVAWFAQDYLLADAWRYLDGGDSETAWRKCRRALSFAPTRGRAWFQGLRLLAVIAARAFRTRRPAVTREQV